VEEKLIGTTDRVFCENGKYRLANHTINDVHPYGWLTIPELIKYSSNIGATKIAVRFGQERYYRYIRGFGFGGKTGIDLPAEARGTVRHWKRWRPVDLAAAGFGQSVGVTALQLTAAVAAIANGGTWMQPVIANGFIDQSGQWTPIHDSRTARQVVQKKTASHVRDMMMEVTKPGGTGIQAAIQGFTVAGKTGTAQMLDPASKRYSSTKFISIFTGFAPADNPRIAMTVVIHEPHGAIYGGVVAAPVFHNVAVQALPYLGACPKEEGQTPGTCAPNLLKGDPSTRPLAVHYTTNDVKVRQILPRNASLGPHLQEDTGAAPGTMPNVVGLSFRSALQQLQRLQGKIQMEGSGQVVGQFPLPGASVNPGEVIELVLEPMTLPAQKKDDPS
ncbi:MAG TPA: penicillin-binding protein, partial [Syntrophobacteraceae bacterium]|nr:penicillin-binding protein [Syntrophobacteraceae bacterium]